MSKKIISSIKHFAMTSQLIEHELDEIEKLQSVDLKRDHKKTLEIDQFYYPQIEQQIRDEAAKMAPYYEMFYSLEKTVKSLVNDTLTTAEPAGWWLSVRVPPRIKQEAEGRQQKEIDSAVTPRSDEPIDFCTFGELGEIIKNNWDIFGSIFSSSKAVERVMSNLNTLRGPIAHCSLLAEDEILRLQLTVRDWFRLME
jgi:hypothetical protein